MGIALIAASCALYCVTYLSAQRSRLRQLEDLVAMLEQMGAELSARMTPLPELAALLKGSCSGAAACFLGELYTALGDLGEESFCRIWRRCAEDSFPLLREDELRALLALGGSLGRYELSAQLRALELCAQVLRERAAQWRLGLSESKKLHMGLACASGALLVILLI